MPITCPECKTTYQVEDSQIGDKGRSVKCIKCENVWHAFWDEPAEAIAATGEVASARQRTAPAPKPRPSPVAIEKVEKPKQAVVEPAPDMATPMPEANTTETAAETDPDNLTYEGRPQPAPSIVDPDGLMEGDAALNPEISTDGGEDSLGAISDEGAEIISNVNQAMMAIETTNPAPAPKVGSGPIIKTEIKVKKDSHTKENVLGIAAFIAVIAMISMAFVFRETIVRTVPEVANIYKA